MRIEVRINKREGGGVGGVGKMNERERERERDVEWVSGGEIGEGWEKRGEGWLKRRGDGWVKVTRGW